MPVFQFNLIKVQRQTKTLFGTTMHYHVRPVTQKLVFKIGKIGFLIRFFVKFNIEKCRLYRLRFRIIFE